MKRSDKLTEIIQKSGVDEDLVLRVVDLTDKQEETLQFLRDMLLNNPYYRLYIDGETMVRTNLEGGSHTETTIEDCIVRNNSVYEYSRWIGVRDNKRSLGMITNIGNGIMRPSDYKQALTGTNDKEGIVYGKEDIRFRIDAGYISISHKPGVPVYGIVVVHPDEEQHVKLRKQMERVETMGFDVVEIIGSDQQCSKYQATYESVRLRMYFERGSEGMINVAPLAFTSDPADIDTLAPFTTKSENLYETVRRLVLGLKEHYILKEQQESTKKGES
jgi:hypothetical protein